MIRTTYLILLLGWCSFSGLTSQSSPAIGQWQDFLPYQQGISVTQSAAKVYYATPQSIVSIDKEDGTISFLSKTNGLSDVGVSQVRYDQMLDQLYVIYTNSNIDVVRSDGVINIPNILANTSITGSKKINDVYIAPTGLAYLSTDFGIVILRGGDLTFDATIQTGIRVNQMTSSGANLYAATSDGLYRFDLSVGENIAAFSNWDLLGPDEGLPSLFSGNAIAEHKGHIYLGIDGDLYKSDLDQILWTSILGLSVRDVQFLRSTPDRLITGWRGPDFSQAILFFDEDDEFIESGNGCGGVPAEAIRDEEGTIYYADLFSRFRISDGYTSPCRQISYNSPFSENVSDIVIKDSDVLIASGGVAENFTFLFTRDGFYLKQEQEWQNFNELDNDQIASLDLLNLYRVAFHPSSSKIYAGSYWAGLLEHDREEDSYTLYNKNNSSLRGSIGDPARERISGLAFDSDENLWVAAYNAPEPLNVLKADGSWISFELPSLGTISDIIIDEQGYLWMPIQGSNGGILVMDSGENLDSPTDDRYRLINQNNSEMTTNTVRSVIEDLNGAVWVGTDEGPVIFDCGTDVFDPSRCPGIRRKVLQEGDGAFLLADQQINAIAIDGGNQKWLGTRSGLFVQSPQGDDQIAHYTTGNSPLLDDEITALAYEPIEGVMWIGTNKGLITLRTASTQGGEVHRKDEVYAFPNPVSPDYRGPIAIRGLVADANIKITDINGLLVSELEAIGGQAVWDGRDLKGNDAASGVYLVFSTDDAAFDNPDSFVTKIMILR